MDFKSLVRKQAGKLQEASKLSLAKSKELKQGFDQKKVERLEKYGKRLKSFSNVTYKGGHPKYTKDIVGSINLHEKRIEFSSAFGDKKFSFPNDKVEVRSETQQEIERRITATRILLVGIFALAFRKKRAHKHGFLTIEYTLKKEKHLILFETQASQKIVNEFKAVTTDHDEWEE